MVVQEGKMRSLSLGVVIRRLPGVTKWAKWSWKAVAVLPGAGDANWQVLRTEGGAVEYHAATLPLQLHRTDTEAYVHGLSAKTPSVYVIMRDNGEQDSDSPFDVLAVTASPYEAQDYADNGEDIVERVPMPAGLRTWIQEFVDLHHEEEVFVKRRRDSIRLDATSGGVGDPRISQATDVYRAPTSGQGRLLH